MTNHIKSILDRKEAALRVIKEGEEALKAAERSIKAGKKELTDIIAEEENDLRQKLKKVQAEKEALGVASEESKAKRTRKSFPSMTDDEIKEQLSALFQNNPKLKTAAILEGIAISPVRFTKFVKENGDFIGSEGVKKTFVYVKK